MKIEQVFPSELRKTCMHTFARTARGKALLSARCALRSQTCSLPPKLLPGNLWQHATLSSGASRTNKKEKKRSITLGLAGRRRSCRPHSTTRCRRGPPATTSRPAARRGGRTRRTGGPRTAPGAARSSASRAGRLSAPQSWRSSSSSPRRCRTRQSTSAPCSHIFSATS